MNWNMSANGKAKPIVSKSARAAPARRLSQAERTAISDGRMLDAAMALIVAHGTQSTTLKEVGEAAGYSRGLASNRFGSKDALFSELVDLFNKRWKAESRAFVGGKTGLDAFAAAIDGVVHFMTENTGYIRAMFILYYETVSSSDLMRERLSEQQAAYRRDVERWMRQGMADGTIRSSAVPNRIAVQYTSFFFGLVYQWLTNPDDIDFTSALHDFRDSIIALIGQR